MNININMTAILGKAWKITWKYKILWIFGMLASFIEGGRSGFNSGNGGSGGGGGGGGSNPDFNTDQFPRLIRDFQENVLSFLSQYWWIFVIAFLAVLLFWLLFYFLGTVGKSGLIHGIYKADLDVEKLSFGELWREGMRYFGRMFRLWLLTRLPLALLGLVVVVIFIVAVFSALVGAREESTAMLGAIFGILGVFLPAVCCLGLLSVFVSMIVEQAKNAMVIKDIGVIESLRQGWAVFRGSFLTIIVMSIILGVLSSIMLTIMALPLLFAIIPAILGAVVIGANSSTDFGAMFASLGFALLCVVAYAPILFFLRGVVLTYTQSALTLTYLRLTTPAPAPVVETSNVE